MPVNRVIFKEVSIVRIMKVRVQQLKPRSGNKVNDKTKLCLQAGSQELEYQHHVEVGGEAREAGENEPC